MYRVLVVDDESIITDSLAFMLENEREPELEVYTAYSAPEAIALLNRIAFHIVVSDIEMPGPSGLELLQEIHEKWPSCQVVFLTGHDNFRYAQQAIRYNVVRYVLKNEGDDILLEVITECIERLKHARTTADYPSDEAMGAGSADKKRSRELLWRHIESRQAADSLAAQWTEAGLCLDPDRGVMLMAGCTEAPLSEERLAAIQAIITALIGHAVKSETVITREKLCVWLMQPAHRNGRLYALAAVKGLAEEIQETVRLRIGLRITFIFDEEEISWCDVPGRLASLQDIAGYRFDGHNGLALVGTGFFAGQDKAPEEAVTGAAFVGHILNYIHDNLGSDLSLTALSERVYLNPSYLSRRFKEITGSNLKDTILNLRMEEACRLLQSSADRVKNIATRLGYESAAHFSRIFKKEMGVTPQRYRDGFSQ